MILSNQTEILYQTLDKKYLNETIDIITSHFVKEEYLTREAQLNYSEFEPYVRAYCELDLAHNLSIIAVDKKTDKVIGFSISEDPELPSAINVNNYLEISKKFEITSSLLGKLHQDHLNITFKQQECCHLFLLGVLPGFQGKRIGKTLVELTQNHAKDKGFKYVLVEATSPATKPICEKLGFKNLGNTPYKDFVFNNQKPFVSITDYLGPYLFIKEL